MCVRTSFSSRFFSNDPFEGSELQVITRAFYNASLQTFFPSRPFGDDFCSLRISHESRLLQAEGEEGVDFDKKNCW